jgi:hypothetical protein
VGVRTLFRAIRYQSSKSDRAVLKWFLIICLLAASAVGLTIFLLFRAALWSPQVKQDSARLDSILANQKIDTVEFNSPLGTNMIVGDEALKFVASLRKTNRIANVDWTKQQVKHVRLLSGTNEVCCLSLGDDGAWEFGSYGFRLRQ